MSQTKDIAAFLEIQEMASEIGMKIDLEPGVFVVTYKEEQQRFLDLTELHYFMFVMSFLKACDAGVIPRRFQNAIVLPCANGG